MRIRLVVPAMLVGAFLTVAGCSEPEVQLVDESGTVREWVYSMDPPDVSFSSIDEFEAMEAAGAAEVTPPEGWDVRVVWGAAGCQTAPTIRVRGSATKITAIEIDHGPAPGNCPDALVLHAVDLRIDPPSAAADIVVSGTRSK